MSAQPSLFIFDWDGTLADSTDRVIQACITVFEEQGWPAPDRERVRASIGLTLERSFESLMPGLSTRDLNRAARRYRELWALGAARPGRLLDGVLDCLSALRQQGALLAVATSKGRGGLESDLRSHRLQEMISCSRCADDAPPKPAPDMLLEIMDELGVLAPRALMIGDTTYDMEMAGAAGVAALGVRSGVHDEPSLRGSGAMDVIDSVAMLPQWLVQCTFPENR